MSLIFVHDDQQVRDLTLKSQIPAEPGGWAGSQKIAESLLSRMLEKAWQKSRPWQCEQDKETELCVPRPAVVTRTQKKSFSAGMKKNIEK
jgi:hypothetical protein